MAKAENNASGQSSDLRSRRGKAVTLPTISIKDVKEGQSIFVRIEMAIVSKEQFDDDGKVKMEKGKPLHIHTANVTDLETGEQGIMVIPYIVNKALLEFGDYVGREFEFVKGAKRNRTNEWAVYELS